MELQEILESKVFVKGNSVNFNSPRAYLEPFLEELQKANADFTVKASGAVRNANDEDKTINTAFGRISVQGKIPGFNYSGSEGTIGIVYALDLQKPLVKVFSGQEVSTCTNMCIWGAEHVYQFDIMGSGMDKAYSMAREYVEKKAEAVELHKKYSEQLLEKRWSIPEVEAMLGRLLHESMSERLGTSAVIAATRDLFDQKSKYAIIGEETSGWNVYNAMTDYLSHKQDIIDMPTKTLLLSKMMIN